ncbi:MAG: hypothetical protein J5639_06895 [Bacteroidales bacterium]|nr:hypothetical protein [Bacteroidales bacterium]
MKQRIYLGVIAIIAGLMFTACSDELIPETIEKENLVPVNENIMVFQASLEQPEAATKTSLSTDGTHVVWTEGDQIRIFNDSHVNGVIFTLKTGDGGKESGTFEGENIGSGPYYAIYPASATDGESIPFAGGSSPVINAVVEANQTYVAGSFGNGANVAVAASDAELSLSFKNVFGAIAFTLKGTATISKVNIYTRASDILNGYLQITNLSSTADPVGVVAAAATEANLYKSLSCGSGVALNNGDGVTFYIIVPVGAFTEGFFVEFIDNAGTAMIKSAKESSKNVVKRSGIIQMAAFTYAPQYSASFLGETKDFAAYSAVTGSGTKMSADQFVSKTVSGTPDQRSVRFQNWNDGYVFTLTAPLPLSHNANITASVGNIAGDPAGINEKTNEEMKVVKKLANRAWIVDATDGIGYVIRLTD